MSLATMFSLGIFDGPLWKSVVVIIMLIGLFYLFFKFMENVYG